MGRGTAPPPPSQLLPDHAETIEHFGSGRHALQNIYAKTEVLLRDRSNGTIPGTIIGRDPDALIQWAQNACPFQEARHSCYFLRQGDTFSQQAAQHAGETAVGSAASLLRSLAGKTVHFVGCSVTRQLMQAVSCRLRHFLVEDNTEWFVPDAEKRFFQMGTCPILNSSSRHCRLERGCAVFAPHRPIGFDIGKDTLQNTTICFTQTTSATFIKQNQYRNGCQATSWESISKVFSASIPRPDILVFSTGATHCHQEGAMAASWAKSLRPEDLSMLNEFAPGRGRAVMLHSWLADGCTEDAARKSAPWKREIEQKYIEPRLRSPRVVGMVLDLYDESVQFASFVHASSAPNFRLNGSPVTDCIHFCMPGAPDRWASRFFQLVAGSTELQAPPPAAVQQSKV